MKRRENLFNFCMGRREFIHALVKGGALGAGLLYGPLMGRLLHAEDASAAKGLDMVVVRGGSPREMTEAAVSALGGMGRFVSRGDVVVVKPNMAWDRVPEQAANTNPDVVASLVELCIEAGAKKVKVLDNTCNDARRSYKRSGIADAAEGAGAEVSFVEGRKFKKMKIGGDVIGEWPVYREFVEADKIINVPIAKHHSIARLTMGMKNWLGAVGGRRNALHQQIDRSIVDLSRFFRPTLTVLDAVRILVRNGPQGGNLSDVRVTNTLAASADPVAVDSFGATLFGVRGSDLGYIVRGEEAGLGVMDFNKLNLRELKLS